MTRWLRVWLALFLMLAPGSARAVESNPPILPDGEVVERLDEVVRAMAALGQMLSVAWSQDGTRLGPVSA